MGLMDSFKIRNALIQHQKGNVAAARTVYEEMYSKGVISAQYMISWSYILLREGGEQNYQKVRELLAKAQKAPDLSSQNRCDLLVNYAVADYKLGNLDKAIALLERVHQKTPCGETYNVLGYLYIEQGDPEKALAFNQSALEYDDEDPVTIDNIGQIYYRLLHDEEQALPYFQKALEIKSSQIDTLWFLSRYDIKNGKIDEAVDKLETAKEGRFSPLNYVTRRQVEDEIVALKNSL